MDWSSAFSCIAAFLLVPALCASDDRLVSGKPLSPGAAAISDGGDFALGFFSPSNSTPPKLYLGIWYNNIPRRTVVWVVNRATPIIVDSSSDSSSPAVPSLALTNTSDLVLSDTSGQIVWTTNLTTVTSYSSSSPSTAVLMNTGNLVIRSLNGTVLWQSFSHPTDTLLPGMKMRLSYRTLAADRLVSWKSPEDPSPGIFSYGGDSDTFLQFFIWNGSRPAWRTSVWTGYMVASSQFQANARTAVYLALVDTDDEISLVFTVSDGAPPTRFLLSDAGKLELLGWNKEASEWMMLTATGRDCFSYGHCGPGGFCDATSAVPTCKCLDGFEPASAEWSSGRFSQGCRRKEARRCGAAGDGHFVALPGMKVPDRFTHVGNRSLDECAVECGGDCNCVAYAYAALSSSARSRGDVTRCLVWTGELVDTVRLGPGCPWGTVGAGGDSRETLYLRVAGMPGKRKQRNVVKIAVPVLASMLIVTCISLSWFCVFKGKKRNVKKLKKAKFREY
ncbi:hypothetical protein E2562_004648 [Oryza meyeriana var. granulata]|uniref:non-specific serine/threonine protein kinase n=1 Tax=Oryza meyeriana var. granulata TaxID=110450 RepID=A0A6G1DEM7_9ORYZ|nr:hypothetical protein E2562_004648 [Oryza meyeriana var. granulata]